MQVCFSGGGIKGYAYIGILKYFEETGTQIKGLSGSSIGALVCLLINLGYTSNELLHLATNLDLSLLEDIQIQYLFSRYAMNDESKIFVLLYFLLRYKGFEQNITFAGLFEKTGKYMAINATNISDYSQAIFDHVSTPNVEVCKAVRASMSIPLFWTPQDIDGIMYVDGCLSKSAPLEVFEPGDDTVAFCLCSTAPKSEPTDIVSYMRKVIACLTHRSNLSEMEIYRLKGYRVIAIDTYHVSALQTCLTKDDINILVASAYNKVKDFLM